MSTLAASSRPAIVWIGPGIMGSSMYEKLIKAGYA